MASKSDIKENGLTPEQKKYFKLGFVYHKTLLLYLVDSGSEKGFGDSKIKRLHRMEKYLTTALDQSMTKPEFEKQIKEIINDKTIKL